MNRFVGGNRVTLLKSGSEFFPALLAAIAEKKDIKGELTDRLKAALAEFGAVFSPAGTA
jgi:hypothetical protein